MKYQGARLDPWLHVGTLGLSRFDTQLACGVGI
jgi:hypothetical protein